MRRHDNLFLKRKAAPKTQMQTGGTAEPCHGATQGTPGSEVTSELRKVCRQGGYEGDCACVCVCACMCARVLCVHVFVCALQVHMHTCVLCMHAYMCTCGCVFVHVCTHVCTHACVYTCVYVRKLLICTSAGQLSSLFPLPGSSGPPILRVCLRPKQGDSAFKHRKKRLCSPWPPVTGSLYA